jgi:squalene cyclase
MKYYRGYDYVSLPQKFRIILCVLILILMQGYNGSQLWDTAFAVQAIMSTNIAKEYGATLRKAHDYIKDSQVLLNRNIFNYILKLFLSS